MLVCAIGAESGGVPSPDKFGARKRCAIAPLKSNGTERVAIQATPSALATATAIETLAPVLTFNIFAAFAAGIQLKKQQTNGKNKGDPTKHRAKYTDSRSMILCRTDKKHATSREARSYIAALIFLR